MLGVQRKWEDMPRVKGLVVMGMDSEWSDLILWCFGQKAHQTQGRAHYSKIRIAQAG